MPIQGLTPFIEPHVRLFTPFLRFRFDPSLQKGVHNILKERRIFSRQIDFFKFELRDGSEHHHSRASFVYA
jgi:hypothetical protein